MPAQSLELFQATSAGNLSTQYIIIYISIGLSLKLVLSGQNRWILVEFIPILQGTGTRLGKSVIGSANSIDSKEIWSALKEERAE